jgi:rhodanese-related sulfurtransferase
LEVDFLQSNMHWVVLAIAAATFIVVDTIRTLGNKSIISPLEATMKINRDDAVVIDVREQGEYAQGHIPNARHIPLGELDRRTPELEKLKPAPIILCCATGARSRGAAAKLKKAGFDTVFNLRGGLVEWEKAGNPLTTGRKPKGKKA